MASRNLVSLQPKHVAGSLLTLRVHYAHGVALVLLAYLLALIELHCLIHVDK